MNNLEMRHLRDQTVVITGASSGVGAAAARRFRQLGATVAVVGRSPERTAAVAAEVDAEPHLVDFSRLDDVRASTVDGGCFERLDRKDSGAGRHPIPTWQGGCGNARRS
jgi:NAD(P)-dependent dehydrogenase (short-subunit alcohol dehydrogenase family)